MQSRTMALAVAKFPRVKISSKAKLPMMNVSALVKLPILKDSALAKLPRMQVSAMWVEVQWSLFHCATTNIILLRRPVPLHTAILALVANLIITEQARPAAIFA